MEKMEEYDKKRQWKKKGAGERWIKKKRKKE
jgi:hypothetical protein